MSIKTFLSTLFQKIVKWLEGVEKVLSPMLTIAENLLNALKTFEATPLGQTVEGIIETFIPASTGLINAFKLQLPVWLIDLKWIQDEANKTLDQQWQDALIHLNSINDPNVRATQLVALKSLFTHFFVTNSTEVVSPTTPFTINHAILLSVPSHDTTIVDPIN